MRYLRWGIPLLILTVLLTGCGGRGRPCAELLAEFREKFPPLANGTVYLAEAEEWEQEAMPADMARILFSEDSGELAFSLCTDYAILLSPSFKGGEIAFLRAGNRTDARRLADMCAARIARVGRVHAGATILQGACVMREGELVVLLLTPDNEAAKTVCRGLL